MNKEKLTIEEIQCLLWYGMNAKEIRNCRISDFDIL